MSYGIGGYDVQAESAQAYDARNETAERGSSAVNDLHRQVEDLSMAISDLAQCLAPVLTPEYDSLESAKMAEPRQEQSLIKEGLLSLANQTARVRSLTRRVEA